MKRSAILPIACTLLLLVAFPGFASAAEMNPTRVFSVGTMQVEILIDEAGEGDASILRNASAELLAQYIPTGKFPMAITSTLVREGKRVTLIDTGMGKKLKKHLRERVITPAEVENIVITHMHFDHIDGLLQQGKPVFPKAQLHIAKKELEYWSNSENIKNFPVEQSQTMTAYFQKSQNVLAAYKGRITTFTPGELTTGGVEIVPGIQAIAAYGHTPGHTVFTLQSQEKKLLVAGDTFHVESIQFPHPEVTIIYDIDQEQAAKTRRALFAFAAANNLLITGMHKIEPEIGQLTANPDEKDGYLFTPAQ